MVTACRGRGVSVAVVLIPDEFQVKDGVLTAALADNGWGREQLDLEGPQRRLAAFFALIPFGCWKLIHGMHHHWTGWQDLDATTATLVPRPLSRVERMLSWFRSSIAALLAGLSGRA